VTTESDDLAQLVADARRMPATILPRPRTASVQPRTIDMTAAEMRIPEATVVLMDGYADYGA
jgi:hypothetical protein